MPTTPGADNETLSQSRQNYTDLNPLSRLVLSCGLVPTRIRARLARPPHGRLLGPNPGPESRETDFRLAWRSGWQLLTG